LDIDQLKTAVTELHQVNDFLQEQVNIMSKEIKSLRAQNTKMPSMALNLGQYELLVEELATENSKLIIENSALKK
jgi:cell division septum initiation protein DivIVA